jgi:hypothetical protein
MEQEQEIYLESLSPSARVEFHQHTSGYPFDAPAPAAPSSKEICLDHLPSSEELQWHEQQDPYVPMFNPPPEEAASIFQKWEEQEAGLAHESIASASAAHNIQDFTKKMEADFATLLARIEKLEKKLTKAEQNAQRCKEHYLAQKKIVDAYRGTQ